MIWQFPDLNLCHFMYSYFYDALVEVDGEVEDEFGGLHPAWKIYKEDKLDVLVDKVIKSGGHLHHAIKVFYGKTDKTEEATDIVKEEIEQRILKKERGV